LKNIKQYLIIKSFLRVFENIVSIQISADLMAVLLVKYLQFLPTKISWNFSNLIHPLRINCFSYLVLYELLEVPNCDKKPTPNEASHLQANKLL
jgi:hypothetical protein